MNNAMMGIILKKMVVMNVILIVKKFVLCVIEVIVKNVTHSVGNWFGIDAIPFVVINKLLDMKNVMMVI